MAFKKMAVSKYPARLWSLVGYPGSGKSTFAAQMRSAMLVVDADHRFDEVMKLAKDVYQLSDVKSDNTDADRVTALLNANMPGTQVSTIVIDSLTAIIAPLVTQAIVDKDAGREKNLYAAFRGKALAMRQLQDACTRWGTDVLWIYHLNDARDAQGKELTKETLSATEVVRLTRSINAQLRIIVENGKRGIKVVWARRGRDGMTVWDETGNWKGMPELLEAAMYDGLSEEEQNRKEHARPEVFASPEIAVAWAMDQGAFDDVQHARNAYDKIKHTLNPKSAREMATVWCDDVAKRLAEINSVKQSELSGIDNALPMQASDDFLAGITPPATTGK